MSRLDGILNFLMDGKVHDIDEVKRVTGLTEDQVMKCLKFMADFNLIMFDEIGRSVAAVLPIIKLLWQNEESSSAHDSCNL